MSKYAPDNGDNWGGSPILPDDWTAVVGGWTKTGFWFSHSAERGRSRPEQEEGGRAEREGEGRGLTDGKGARRELAVRGKGEMAIERCGGRVSEI